MQVVLDIIFIKYTYISKMCEFWSGTSNKFQYVVYFKSAVAFFMVTVMNFGGGKGPLTN